MWTANGFLDDEEPFDPKAITPQAAQPRRRTALVACLGVVVFAAGAWGMRGTRDLAVERAAEIAVDESRDSAERRLGLLRIRASVLSSVESLREIAEGDDPQLASSAQQTLEDLRSSLSD